MRQGFAVVEGAIPHVERNRIFAAFEHAIEAADRSRIRQGSTTIRVDGLLEQDLSLSAILTTPCLLEAAAELIEGPFKLSSFLARNVRPWSVAQPLHQDVMPNEDGWPLLGYIFMIDDFREDNGATRFVSGSQMKASIPPKLLGDLGEQYACGPAGSMILYNGSVWHGHGANLTSTWRRSIQGALIPASATAAADYSGLVRRRGGAMPVAVQRLLTG
jgi:hypothetical protein